VLFCWLVGCCLVGWLLLVGCWLFCCCVGCCWLLVTVGWLLVGWLLLLVVLVGWLLVTFNTLCYALRWRQRRRGYVTLVTGSTLAHACTCTHARVWFATTALTLRTFSLPAFCSATHLSRTLYRTTPLFTPFSYAVTRMFGAGLHICRFMFAPLPFLRLTTMTTSLPVLFWFVNVRS